MDDTERRAGLYVMTRGTRIGCLVSEVSLSIFNRLFTTFLKLLKQHLRTRKTKVSLLLSLNFILFTEDYGGFCFSSFLHHTAKELKS